MRILAKKTIRDFWKKHPDTEQQLKAWYQEVSKDEWLMPSDVTIKYPNARIIPDNRIIFKIKGNKYRLVIKVNYNFSMVFIRFIDTHAEYDKIDPLKI